LLRSRLHGVIDQTCSQYFGMPPSTLSSRLRQRYVVGTRMDPAGLGQSSHTLFLLLFPDAEVLGTSWIPC
jgi:hypothetical protein